MRPRKIVLLMDANEERRGLLRFQLETWGYAVLAAADGEAAIAQCGQSMLIVAAADFPEAGELLAAFFGENASRRQIVIASSACDLVADAVLLNPSGTELREAVRQHIAKRRGPLPHKIPMTSWRCRLLEERKGAA